MGVVDEDGSEWLSATMQLHSLSVGLRRGGLVVLVAIWLEYVVMPHSSNHVSMAGIRVVEGSPVAREIRVFWW